MTPWFKGAKEREATQPHHIHLPHLPHLPLFARRKSHKDAVAMGNANCCPEEESKPGVLEPSSNGCHADDRRSTASSHRLSLRSVRSHVIPKPVHHLGHLFHNVASHVHHAVEKVIFVPSETSTTETTNSTRTVRGGVLLYDCETPQEHFEKHDAILEILKEFQHYGEGLRAAGLELRMVPCPKHASLVKKQDLLSNESSPSSMNHHHLMEDGTDENHDGCEALGETPEASSAAPDPDESSVSDLSIADNNNCHFHFDCDDCVTRLYHFHSQTIVDHSNRKQFVADGPMYDEVARLCMHYAHDQMIQLGDLQWVTIVDDGEGPPVQALVSKSHPAAGGCEFDKPTLLVVTGKGKVRAGIFSRQHIQTTGVEPSTALFVLRQAKKRNLHVVMLDPNVRGERQAFSVIDQSMRKLFGYILESSDQEQEEYPLLIQAHSMAGSYVVRHLLDCSKQYLRHVRAIAFTDSTHNIQWCKTVPELFDFLESSASIYFRSSKEDCAEAGREINSDANWRRRFGNIRTCWAGTTEHSLSDWSAREFIWKHFDRHLENSATMSDLNND